MRATSSEETAVPGELVSMPEAALIAYIAAFGIDTTISRLHRNNMAETLSRLLTVYSVSADGASVRKLTQADLRGGSFTEGGRSIRFADEREPISGLAVMRQGLKAAVAALKDAYK